MKQYFALALLTLVLVSCKKKDDDDHIDFSGTIAIDTPAENDTINGGSSFFVTGTITGNMEMHGYHVIVYNEDDQSVVYENQYHEHGTSYVVNEAVTHTLSTGTPLRLYIQAAGDHEGQTVTKERLFYYVP
jgi:hypothetical protein